MTAEIKYIEVDTIVSSMNRLSHGFSLACVFDPYEIHILLQLCLWLLVSLHPLAGASWTCVGDFRDRKQIKGDWYCQFPSRLTQKAPEFLVRSASYPPFILVPSPSPRPTGAYVAYVGFSLMSVCCTNRVTPGRKQGSHRAFGDLD